MGNDFDRFKKLKRNAWNYFVADGNSHLLGLRWRVNGEERTDTAAGQQRPEIATNGSPGTETARSWQCAAVLRPHHFTE